MENVKFRRLTSIGNWNLKEPAVMITNNYNLGDIEAHSLVFVATSHPQTAVITNNRFSGRNRIVDRLKLLVHPMQLDIDNYKVNTSGVQLHRATIAVAIATAAALLIAIILVCCVAVLRRIYNKRIDSIISMSLILADDFDLDDSQKDRLRQYANEVLKITLADWKAYCEKVITVPKRDPNYRKKPKKTPEERKAEQQLKMMNIEIKKKRGPVRKAELPKEYAELTPPMLDKRRQLYLTPRQKSEFATFTRSTDEDHNLGWGGDLYAGYNKIFMGGEQGKIVRREMPTKPGDTLVIGREKNDAQIEMKCENINMLSPCVIEFKMVIKTKRLRWSKNIPPSHTFNTSALIFNGWVDDGFPKDLRSLMRLLYSAAMDTRRSTILVGYSTDASCELCWMMVILVKAVLGMATAARLSSILEACIIILRPSFLTPHHFFYFLKFILNWSTAVGVLTDKDMEVINEWRNEYHKEEVKAEARLYGRPYLRVISLDPVDPECDQVLLLLDGTHSLASSSTSENVEREKLEKQGEVQEPGDISEDQQDDRTPKEEKMKASVGDISSQPPQKAKAKPKVGEPDNQPPKGDKARAKPEKRDSQPPTMEKAKAKLKERLPEEPTQVPANAELKLKERMVEEPTQVPVKEIPKSSKKDEEGMPPDDYQQEETQGDQPYIVGGGSVNKNSPPLSPRANAGAKNAPKEGASKKHATPKPKEKNGEKTAKEKHKSSPLGFAKKWTGLKRKPKHKTPSVILSQSVETGFEPSSFKKSVFYPADPPKDKDRDKGGK